MSKSTIQRFSPGQDGAQLWVDDALGGMEVMATRLVRHAFAPHAHDTLMLGMVLNGAKRFKRDGRTHIAAPRTISMVNPGDWHTGQSETGEALEYYALYLPTGLFDDSERRPRFVKGVVDDRDLHDRLRLACALIIGRAERLQRDEQLREALACLKRRHGDVGGLPSTRPSCPRGVSRARDLLHARFQAQLSVRYLADAACLSPNHLMREFRRSTGTSLHAYQTQLRVGEAKRLILSGCSLAEIAPLVGFSDQAQLTRRFKAITGMPPGQWKAAMA